MSHFNYCPIIWHFCSRKNILKVEKINERGLRFVYNDYVSDYNNLLSQNNSCSMTLHCLRNMATEVYKCVNSIGPEFMNDMFRVKNIAYDLRNGTRLEQTKFSTIKYGFKSFSYHGASIWNKLPVHTKDSESLDIFKTNINSWSGTFCECSACADVS